MSEVSELVGTREAAEIVGVRPPNFVRDWASRHDFPQPRGRLARGRVWDRAEVEQFARLKGPQRGVALGSLPLSARAARALPTIKQRLVRRYAPQRIVLFGSQVTGAARADSDIDLLVVVPDGIDPRAMMHDIASDLADVPVSKDVIVTTPARIERFGDVSGTLIREAVMHGVTIYARS